jgi:hypothetical protein
VVFPRRARPSSYLFRRNRTLVCEKDFRLTRFPSTEIRMQKNVVVAGVVLVFLLGAIVTRSVSRRPSYVDISGHVYERRDSTGAPVAPVIGARVSNDWDSITATTNVLGEYRLRTRRVAADEWVKLTARAGERAACQRRLGSLKPRMVDIVLNDPMQGFGRCQPD